MNIYSHLWPIDPISTRPPTTAHKAAWLLERTAANDGLAHWTLNVFGTIKAAPKRDAFAVDSPQCPLGITGMSGECVWAELGIPEDYFRYESDPAFRRDLNIAYNNVAERIVGRRILGEKFDDPSSAIPRSKCCMIFSKPKTNGTAGRGGCTNPPTPKMSLPLCSTALTSV